MKNYNVSYTKGHLIDKETGKRIFLKRGGSFTLLGDDDQFEEKDILTTKISPLNSQDKLDSLEKKYNHHKLVKVAEQGATFVYRIGISKRTNEDVSMAFLFNAVLFEDLYIKAKCNAKNKNDEVKWSLCDCICETTDCLDGDIQLFENVQGTSLSNLFSNMVAFYFPMQRSGACNAFNTFFFAEQETHSLFEVEQHQYKDYSNLKNIDDFRKKQSCS
jgi:hypothetical protein